MRPSPCTESGRARVVYALALVGVAVATVGVLALLDSVAQRKDEEGISAFRVVELTEETVDPVEWGKNFPRQFDSYRRTVDVTRTRHGGSEAFQKLEADPTWRELFAGYAFGVDYREERGHAYMLQDQRETERVTRVQQPGACLHCHASITPAYRKVGVERGAPGDLSLPLSSPEARTQLMRGFEAVCAMTYAEATKLVEHPVACVDCHDPKTMQLRVSRPAFLTGVAVLAAGVDEMAHVPSIARWRRTERSRPYDPNRDADRQEMRSLVCAQCHVEYYLQGEGKLLVYPWSEGLRQDDIEAYYDEVDFADWTHLLTGAPLLKAQHPEFELWSQGIHARSGVSCSDCHMPYVGDGALRVSDHHVRSPLLNVTKACQVCHDYSETELVGRATAIQDRTQELMLRAEGAVLDLVRALQQARESGAGDEALYGARDHHRRAQWRLDFVAAENSMGFHAPQEAACILAAAIDHARLGELAVLRLEEDQE